MGLTGYVEHGLEPMAQDESTGPCLPVVEVPSSAPTLPYNYLGTCLLGGGLLAAATYSSDPRPWEKLCNAPKATKVMRCNKSPFITNIQTTSTAAATSWSGARVPILVLYFTNEA